MMHQMVWYVVLNIIMIITSSFLLPVGASEESIRAGESINNNETLTSAGGNFALGFFSPGNSMNRYIGIWYNTISKQTVIWVANRENPLAKISHGFLLVWSSNATIAKLAMNSTVAVLLDTGNLVLRHGETGTVLWHSFDYPTDTLIPGMKLNWPAKPSVFVANNANPQPGMFSGGIDPEGCPQIFIWKQYRPFWKSTVYDYSLVYIDHIHQGFASFLTFIKESDEIYLTCCVPENLLKVRVTLTPTGQAQLLFWAQSSNSWVVVWQAPVVECDFYGYCGPFSSCEQNGSHPFCSCLEGFEPRDQKEWNLGNWTGGCARKMELTCDKGDWFFKFERTRLPDYSVSLGNVVTTALAQLMLMLI
ncbi:unnamed protein product [Camellia sinensis]